MGDTAPGGPGRRKSKRPLAPPMDYDADKVDDAVLALLWLTAWREAVVPAGALGPGEPAAEVWRAWKGFDCGALDRLHAAGLIDEPEVEGPLGAPHVGGAGAGGGPVSRLVRAGRKRRGDVRLTAINRCARRARWTGTGGAVLGSGIRLRNSVQRPRLTHAFRTRQRPRPRATDRAAAVAMPSPTLPSRTLVARATLVALRALAAVLDAVAGLCPSR